MSTTTKKETSVELQNKRTALVNARKKKKPIHLSKELTDTIKAAKLASSTAVRISKALELSVQFIEKGKLVEVNALGEKMLIKEIKKVKSKLDLAKGDKICLKPKG